MVVLSLMLTFDAQAAISTGEYYIVNNFWDKLLTSNNSNEPRLMAYDSNNDEAFIFVAEASGSSGYVKLKHKNTGLYLTASTSNTWSVLLYENGSGDQYLWAVDQLFDTYIVSKKNTSCRLGSDFYSGSGSNYTYYFNANEIPVYYDKSAGALNWYSIIPANGNGFNASRKVAKTTTFTNEYGVTEQDDYRVSEPVEVNGIDYHIISTTPFEGIGCVNLIGRTSWLIFENIRPSKVISSYLGNVTIDGQTAVNGTNCRVEIWMRGAVVIPIPSDNPFVATTDEGSFSVPLGNTTDLGENSNKARSFTLKRGYMATVATAKNGGDYSRIYVADHGDLTVTLPTPLDQRITSVYVRNWHYTSKAGYCSTKGDVLTATSACGSSWAWNWDASLTSSTDVEYIPIKQHLFWPSDGNFYKENSTALMLFNEPEHSEQHTSSKCSCGGAIDEWKAYTHTPKFNATGLRIGSPSATSLSWIKQYLQHCDNMKQRCDFSCTHGYWTSEWANNLSTLASYKRPIWITEWEYGASWTSGSNPNSADDARAKVFDILERLEYNDYVERYSYYEFDTGGTNGWMREIFWENNASKGLAYVGEVYSRVKPHFGYKASIQPVPNWWEPSTSKPEITGSTKLANGQYTLSVTNDNGDCTGSFQIVRKTSDGTWESIYTITDRSVFESTELTITLPNGLLDIGDEVKVVMTTIFKPNTEIESSQYNIPRKLSDLQNLEFNDGTFTDEDITIGEFDNQNTVTGWTPVEEGTYHSAGQLAWNSDHYLGTSNYVIPETNSEGTNTGGALALLAAWSALLQYTQNVYLEAGTYSITIPVYNGGGTTAIAKNLFGFIADDGTEYLATTTTFNVGTWTTLTISFVLNEDTYGQLSVGYKHVHSESGKAPHLFVDAFRINHSTELPSLSALDNLQNLRFDEGIYTTEDITIGEYDGQKEVTGWTSTVSGNYRSAGQQAWGSGLHLGTSDYTIPDTDSREKTYGGGLALLAAWNAQLQYTQPVTLPAGTYTLTIPVYNVHGTTAIDKNLFGFVTDSGKEYFATPTTFTEGEWTTMSMKITLMEETPGKFSVGYTHANSSSSNAPHLYVDYVQITCGNRQWPSFIVGDINKDKSVTIADVIALVDIIFGKDNAEPYLYDHTAADVNEDGAITIADVTAIVNIILEKSL